MKKAILSVSLAMFAAIAYAQENRLTFSGGYAFANLEETDIGASGWRINGLYELLMIDSRLSHGISFGYINMTASGNLIDYKISTLPMYYAPKFTFGEKSLKGFIKGAFGWQWSTIKREAATTVNPINHDNGFYTGLAVGGTKDINESLAISLEYEWAFMVNGFFRDGFVNSIQLGIGYSF